jgi:hypothetical protein
VLWPDGGPVHLRGDRHEVARTPVADSRAPTPLEVEARLSITTVARPPSDAFGSAMPQISTVDDAHRYHGGPKSNY